MPDAADRREARGTDPKFAGGPALRSVLGQLADRGRRLATGAETSSDGRYRLIAEIARGGIGVVLRGRDDDLGRDVAVKILREDRRDDFDAIGRFLEEARIGGRLQHPGIVPVYELGLTDRLHPFFAMKLVEGENLTALLDRRARPSDERRRFLGIFEQVCHTIAYAHSRGVIHRDLKPSNVMVGAFSEVLVVDWGLAKVMGRVSPAETQRNVELDPGGSNEGGAHSVEGRAFGTPAYMPPEQARGDLLALDERSDVFALGAMLCQILIGRPPYEGDCAVVLRRAAVADLGDLFSVLAESDADPELVALCRRCLAAKPADRPRHAGEVAAAVSAHLAAVEERARLAQLAAAEARGKAQHERKARRLTLALATAILVILVGGAATAWWLDRDERRRAAETERGVRASLADASRERGAHRYLEANRAAARARALLDAGPARAELREEALALAAEIESEAEETIARDRKEQENRELLAALEHARRPEDRFEEFGIDWKQVDAERAALFARIGFDPHADVVAGIGTVHARGIDLELATALDEWATVRVRAGDKEGARRLATVALALDPEPKRTRLRTALDRDDREELRTIARETDLVAYSTALVDRLACTLADAGHLDESVVLCQRAQRLHPFDFVLNVDLARQLLDLKPPRAADAAGFLRAAIASRPDAAALRYELAFTLRTQLAEPQSAADVAADALELDPDDPYLRKELVADLATARRFDEALARGEEFLREQETARAHEALAFAHYLRGDYASAGEQAAAATRLDGKSVEAFHTLAASQLNQGQRDEAIASAERALALDSSRAPTHVIRGVALYQKALYETFVLFRERSCEQAAVDELREAHRLDPGLLDVGRHLAAADVHLAGRNLVRGELDAAIANAKEATRVDETSADAFETLAIALHAGGELRAALDASRKAGALRANDPCVFAHQAFLIEEGADPAATAEDERRLAQLATSLDPEQDHADHWLALALVCCRMEHWEGAVDALEHALRLRSEDPAAAFLLARAQWELLDESAAESALDDGERWLEGDRIQRVATCRWRTDASQRALRSRLHDEAERALTNR
jgi:serine/threonine-protein kinase